MADEDQLMEEQIVTMTQQELNDLAKGARGASRRKPQIGTDRWARQQIVRQLAQDGKITQREAAQIGELDLRDVSVKKFVDWIAGKYNIAPSYLAKITRGTSYSVTQSQITPTTKSIELQLNETGSSWIEETVADDSGIDLASKFLRTGVQKRVVAAADWVTDRFPESGERPISDEENLAWRNRAVEELDYLHRNGAITDKDWKALTVESRESPAGWSKEMWNRVYNVVEEAYSDWDYTDSGTGQDEAIKQDAFLHNIKRFAGITDSTVLSNGAVVDTDTYVAADDIATTTIGTNGFINDAAAAGFFSGGPQQYVPQPIMDVLTWSGADYVYDPSTDIKWSHEQWRTLHGIVPDPDNQGQFIQGAWDSQAVQDIRALYLASKKTRNEPPAIVADLMATDFYQKFGPKKKTTKGRYDPETGRYIPPTTTTYGQNASDRMMQDALLADLQIQSAIPTGLPWEDQKPRGIYFRGDGYAEWFGMSARKRDEQLRLFVHNDLMTENEYESIVDGFGIGGNPYDVTASKLWETVVALSSEAGMSRNRAIQTLGTAVRTEAANQPRGGSGGRGPTYSVPSSLREIPDYKTLAQQTKSVFRNELGRDLEDWELQILADQLKSSYEEANRERIALHRAAWEDAVSGGSVDVDFGAVDDPTTALQYDIEERYANEISRNEDVAMAANRHRILMDSIAVGQRMI